MQKQMFKHNLRQISNSTSKRSCARVSETEPSGSDEQPNNRNTRKLTDTVDFFGDSLE